MSASNNKDYDFGGWATKNDLRCTDGRIIRHGAFAPQDGKRVPLVWNHQHNSPEDTLGHAILENRDDGVYAYCYFNGTGKANHAKECVKHGDVTSLSIWANNLEQVGSEVLHGVIREVSLVLAGANPGAFIESVLAHGEPMEDGDEEGIFYAGSSLELIHADSDKKTEAKTEEKKTEEKKTEDSKSNEDSSDETVGDVYNTLTEKQKKAVAVIVGQAIVDSKGEKKDDKEDDNVKHNVFDDNDNHIAHSITEDDMKELFRNAKACGSLREAIRDNMENGGVLAHGIPTDGMETAKGNQTYGFNDPSMLFPDYRALTNTPEWLSRNMEWVQEVLGNVHHTPFSRIKSVFADITEDEARAKGYIKGKQKKEEVFATLKRTTDPQTIYKLQKMDRDDIIDITDFDVIAWIKAEMRVMLNEEIARAILIGDGRQDDAEDKIKEDHVRPICKDVPLFNTTYEIDLSPKDMNGGAGFAKAVSEAMIRSRRFYKGSGNPTFFTTEDVLTEMLLLEDGIGHKLYKTEAEFNTAHRISKTVTVEPMEGAKLSKDDDRKILGVIVNLKDYNVGADKGGEINMFDDFDIDFNQQKYLIETRISGALIKPFSAITLVARESTFSPKVEPINGGTTVLGKQVSDLQRNVKIDEGTNKITGELLYAKDFRDFDKTHSENQQGNYLAIQLDSNAGDGSVIEVEFPTSGVKKLDADKQVIVKLTNETKRKPLKVTIKKDESGTVVEHTAYDMSALRLVPAPAED